MNIYIGNLALEITEDELRQEFTPFGEVIAVTIMNDMYIGSGQPRRYGYVDMPSKSEGENAVIALNGKTLRHREVAVIRALPLSDNKDSVSHRQERNTLRNSKVRGRRNRTAAPALDIQAYTN